jgi:hypothetical protein
MQQSTQANSATTQSDLSHTLWYPFWCPHSVGRFSTPRLAPKVREAAAFRSTKPVGSQRGEGTVEIIGSEGEMAIVVVDVAAPEGAGRMDDQMHLQGAAGEPDPTFLKGGRSMIVRPNRF